MRVATTWPAMSTHAGAGVPRTRLNTPASRRLTLVMHSDTKLADTTPITMKPGTCSVERSIC